MTINNTQEFRLYLLQTNHLASYQKFHQQILIFLKTFNAELSYIEVWFTDQNSKPPKREDKINISLALN